METQPLDPRPNSCEITQLAELATSEVTLRIPKITKADAASLVVVSTEQLIIEEMNCNNRPMMGAFCVGDRILKVNSTVPTDAAHFAQLMTNLSPCTVVVARRSFVTAPGYQRLRDALTMMGLQYRKGFSYQVVNCKKQAWDRFLETTFGFDAMIVWEKGAAANKCIIGEIWPETAAEKYFSVGDCLLDFHGVAIQPGLDPCALTQFQRTFKFGQAMDVLVERPVSKDARAYQENLIERFLELHKDPEMNEDAVNIGVNAAHFHNKYWSKLDSVSILINPPPVDAATPAADTPSEQPAATAAATTVASTPTEGEESGKKIAFDEIRSFQEISSSVPEGTELQRTGHPFVGDGEDDDDTEYKDGTEQNKDKPDGHMKMDANTAPRGPVVTTVIKEKKKSKRGLFSAIFNRLKK